MTFKSQPNLYIKINNKVVQRVTGIKGFYFDAEGLYSTENELLIKLLSQNFEAVKTENNTVVEHAASEEINESEIRKKAKEKGINKWHVKSIERLIEELKEV